MLTQNKLTCSTPANFFSGVQVRLGAYLYPTGTADSLFGWALHLQANISLARRKQYIFPYHQLQRKPSNIATRWQLGRAIKNIPTIDI
jgi:hypothetical protein